MPIKVRCQDCQTVLNLPDAAAGKVARCKSCGGRVRVPGAGAAAAAGKRRAAPEPEVDDEPNPDLALQNLDLRRIEDTQRKVCPNCAAPVRVDEVECPKCKVMISTGTLSERQRKLIARKGPPPEEFYGAIWKDGGKFLKKHMGLAFSTAIIWTTCLTMSMSCLNGWHYYVESRSAELAASADLDPNVFNDGFQVRIVIVKGTSARYDGKFYSTDATKEETIYLPGPRMAAEQAPPAVFWLVLMGIFQLGFGGWSWTLAKAIAETTLAGQKKLKRFRPDFFGNLTMGFRFYIWPLVLMMPFIWIGPLVAQLGYPEAGGLTTAGICLVAYLLFLPAAVVHMAQRYSFRAWLLVWMVRDFFKTIGASLYVATLSVFLVLLVPLGTLGAILALSGRIMPWFEEQKTSVLAWLASNVMDMGEGNLRFLFYEMPFVFAVLFVLIGLLSLIAAFPAVFMMRVIGQYGVYFRPDLSIVGEFADNEPASFGPRFLAFLIDSIILTLWSLLAGFVGGLFKVLFADLYGWGDIGLYMAGGLTLLIWVVLVVLYFARGESGATRGTLGKWSLGMIVLREDDKPLKREDAYRRMMCAILTYFTLYIGFLICLFRPDKRAMHDLMSKTKVVWRGEDLST